MHPVMTQAIAAERAREFQAYAAAAGHARQLRRSARARRLRRLPRGGPGPALLAAARLLRDPGAA
jgi:hypothetical protein